MVASVCILILVGLVKVIRMDINFIGLVGGSILIALLLFALTDEKDQYGLSSGSVVNLSMIFVVSAFFVIFDKTNLNAALLRYLYATSAGHRKRG